MSKIEIICIGKSKELTVQSTDRTLRFSVEETQNIARNMNGVLPCIGAELADVIAASKNGNRAQLDLFTPTGTPDVVETPNHDPDAAVFLSHEQIWQNEQTRYWFRIPHMGEYCVCEDPTGTDYLDCEGVPLNEGTERRTVRRMCVVTESMRLRAAGL